MIFHKPIKAWDLVYPVAYFDSFENKSAGQIMRVRQELLVDGDVACEIYSGYLIRGQKKPSDGNTPPKKKPAPEPVVESKPSTDSAAVREYGKELPLTWDVFPRPYCISALPHRDITMQGVRDVGDFRFYQGVWRMQPLPGCAPPGSSAMRLTYSVELSPRAWVPVALLEGRIASALGENLEAVRDFVIGLECPLDYEDDE